MLFGFLVIRIIIISMILRVILRLVARHEADLSWDKILMVTAITSLGTFAIRHFGADYPSNYILIARVVWVVIMVMSFLWVSFIRTLIVVAIYALLHFALVAGADSLVRKIIPEKAQPLLEKEERRARVKKRVDNIQKKKEQAMGVTK